MNIEISTSEYRTLLDILHIADVVMSGHRREEDIRTGEHRKLIQKLYALAQAEGLDQLIGYSKSVNRYIPTGEFERSSLAHVVLDEFGEHLFWDQLISRLTERDMVQLAGGIDRLNAMSDSDRQHAVEHVRQQYVDEFAKNGVGNLTVLEHFTTTAMPLKTSD